MIGRELPAAIKEVGFDFMWDVRKVWSLDYPTETMQIEDLTWHFDVPFIWSKPDGYYDVNPRWVIDNPAKYPDEYVRTMHSNTDFPIDIMFWKKRWLILDGLHRLMKQAILGRDTVHVRKIPLSAIPQILK